MRTLISTGYDNEMGAHVRRYSDGSVERATGNLMDYDTGEFIRESTIAEHQESVAQATRDGGAGVISVDGRRCYVEG